VSLDWASSGSQVASAVVNGKDLEEQDGVKGCVSKVGVQSQVHAELCPDELARVQGGTILVQVAAAAVWRSAWNLCCWEGGRASSHSPVGSER